MRLRTGPTIALLALAAPVQAQDSGRASDRALAPLVACRPIPDPRARASCYDGALDRLQQAVAGRQVVVMDREQVREDRRSAFGFVGETVPRPKPVRQPKSARGTAALPEDIATIDTTATSASPFGYDRWTIRLATGAIWRTTEAGIATAPRAGSPIHIRRGVMGGFLLRVGKGRTVRAMRVG